MISDEVSINQVSELIKLIKDNIKILIVINIPINDMRSLGEIKSLRGLSLKLTKNTF